MSAMNPLVPQPGLPPNLMSLKPKSLNPREYNNGLRKPSGRPQLEMTKSVYRETMPATVWIMAVNWVLENKRGRAEAAGYEERRRTETEQVVPSM